MIEHTLEISGLDWVLEVGWKAASWMHNILDGVEDGWVRPHVDKTFPLEEAAKAHRYIEERKNIGKVVLVV